MLDVRVRDREGCVLEPDKWGGMARVMMAMLRGLVVEIIFASRVVSVILRCRAAVGTVSGGTVEELQWKALPLPRDVERLIDVAVPFWRGLDAIRVRAVRPVKGCYEAVLSS